MVCQGGAKLAMPARGYEGVLPAGDFIGHGCGLGFTAGIVPPTQLENRAYRTTPTLARLI
jgi:hypothetical protein